MTKACRLTIAKPRTTLSLNLTPVMVVTVMLAVATSLVLGGMLHAAADTQASAAALPEERKIIHLLNRIGYGPRPGDIERVKRVGLDKYIAQQLLPETIDEVATEARLAGLNSLRMTIAELSEKYPEQGAVERQLGLRPPATRTPDDSRRTYVNKFSRITQSTG